MSFLVENVGRLKLNIDAPDSFIKNCGCANFEIEEKIEQHMIHINHLGCVIIGLRLHREQDKL